MIGLFDTMQIHLTSLYHNVEELEKGWDSRLPHPRKLLEELSALVEYYRGREKHRSTKGLEE